MKVEKYNLLEWHNYAHGLLIAENNKWVLVKHIPNDYVVDGYRLYKKEFIESRIRSAEEEQVEKVLLLKGIQNNAPQNFNFSDTIGHLDWVEKTYGIFEFQDADETELFYGKKNKINDDKLIIDMIKTNGTIEADYDYKFNISQIRVITFETDYFTSIQLL